MLLLSPAEAGDTPWVTLLLTAMVNEKMDREWDARARARSFNMHHRESRQITVASLSVCAPAL